MTGPRRSRSSSKMPRVVAPTAPAGVTQLLRRLAEAESRVQRANSVFGELLTRMSNAHGGEPDLSGLRDLLAVSLATLDLTRATTGDDMQKLTDVRDAMPGARHAQVERALGVTLDKGRNVLDRTAPVDRAIARVVERLREIERRERELRDLREELLREAGELLADVQDLRDAVAVRATAGERRKTRSTLPPPPPSSGGK